MLLKKIDLFITKPLFSIPLFFVILFLIFQTTFTIWWYISDFLDIYLNKFYNLFDIKNTLINSVFWWILGVIIFVPNIFILYIFLFLLNDSWILPRISFVFDKLLKKLWLSSKSLLSISLWFWCTVGAILSTKNITNIREKIITIFILPFISCSAKIPVFTLFISMFIPKELQSLTFFLLIIFWLVIWLISTYFMNLFVKKSNNDLLVSIPRYKLPSIKQILIKIYIILKEFLFKIWILVLPISIILSLAFTYPKNVDINETYWAKIWSYINWIFEPIGFNQEMSLSVIWWLAWKEITVSTISSLYYIKDDNYESLKTKLLSDDSITFASIVSFLVFILLYTPCILAVVTAKNELWYKLWFLFFIYPIIVAWLISYIIYNILK